MMDVRPRVAASVSRFPRFAEGGSCRCLGLGCPCNPLGPQISFFFPSGLVDLVPFSAPKRVSCFSAAAPVSPDPLLSPSPLC